MDIKAKALTAIHGMDGILLHIQASGGYKYRQLIQGTDQEVHERMREAVPLLRGLAVSQVVAEEMLQEQPPLAHYGRTHKTGVFHRWMDKLCAWYILKHGNYWVESRWQEFTERKARLLGELAKEKPWVKRNPSGS